jgi:DNA-binding protein H-NS
VCVSGNDEVKLLADEINKMIHTVNESKKEIHDVNIKLQEKIRDLEKFKEVMSDSEIYAESLRLEKETALKKIHDLEQELAKNTEEHSK